MGAFPGMTVAQAPAWVHEFVPFTLFHMSTVAVCAAAMLGACWMGKRWYGTLREVRLRHAWGWTVLAFQLFSTAWWLTSDRYDVAESLPLQLCDLAAFTAALAMLTNDRRLRTLLYFWGIGLSTQAFFTPIVPVGPAHLHYWLFFIGHTMIVGSAVYDIVVGGYRPKVRDLSFVCVVTLTWGLAVFALNLALDVNYGYIGKTKPQRPTLIDKLGPWPHRVFVLAALVVLDYILLWMVWPLARMITRRRGGPGAPWRGRADGTLAGDIGDEDASASPAT